MTLSPIPRVLSTFRKRGVKTLLMGGQACILYGAAEFSRDIDFAVAVSGANLQKLRAALRDLEAESVLFPSLSERVLRRGHACHFRCLAPGLNRLRIDLMSRMRGVAPFHRLWRRREELALPRIGRVAVMALPDLVHAKKTQRDKDWPMIRRLLEADIVRVGERATSDRIRFWLEECRTPALLVELVRENPRAAKIVAKKRPAVRAALENRTSRIERALDSEVNRERRKDRIYWKPLMREIERWRLGRKRLNDEMSER
ncbi:MAG: hypothetical protein A2Z34_05330 [Planctomycetes bacterium RBG_16_59_8]|nr:MAG: hypothetical protein A2Z34_05330 [Planctomycetes bacterium RBG_16_59_8]